MPTQINEERLGLVALAWLWCQRGKPATAANLASGIKAMLPEGSAKRLAPPALDRLVQTAHAERIEPVKKRAAASFKIAPAGETQVKQWLGRDELPTGSKPFSSISNYLLPAIAGDLPIPQSDAKSQRAFAKLLPVGVCVRKLGLAVPLDRGPEVAKLELVKLCLSQSSRVPADRIYLKKVPGGELPAIVVGPWLGEPGTLSKNLDTLLTGRACFFLGQTKASQIKSAVVRRWLSGDQESSSDPLSPVPRGEGGGEGSGVERREPHDSSSHPSPQPSPLSTGEREPEAAPQLDLAAFSRHALDAAKAVARDGGPGVSSLGEKVLVHYVWRHYEQMFGKLPLGQFKRNLSDANVNHLVLVREDWIPEGRAQEFSDSEVRTGASVYHYIRVRKLGEHHA